MKKGRFLPSFFYNKKLNTKKMEHLELNLKDEKKLEINSIEETPFSYVETEKGKYIICGKVVLETELTKEKAALWLNDKPWEAIALLCQGLIYEMNNEKK